MKKRRSYHHGALREALVSTALEMLDESGAEAVIVREVARRAGVSPAAPFRHFEDRAALLGAVSEEIRKHFRAQVDAAVRDAGDNPQRKFRAIGLAYVRYAIAHPRRFQLIHAESYASPAALARGAGETQAAALKLIVEGQRQGLLRDEQPALIELAAHALVYGLSRMIVEGHIPRDSAEPLAEAVLDVLGRGLSALPGSPTV